MCYLMWACSRNEALPWWACSRDEALPCSRDEALPWWAPLIQCCFLTGHLSSLDLPP